MKKFRGNGKRSLVALLATSLAVGTLTGIGLVGNTPAAQAFIDRAGNQDGSFNASGLLSTNLGQSGSTVAALAVGAQSRPVVAMQHNPGTASLTAMTIARFTTTGGFDRTWGVAGRITLELKDYVPTLTRALPRDLFIDSQNRTYVLSQVADAGSLGSGAFNVTRLLPDGSVDPGFGSIFRNFITSGVGEAYAIAVGPSNIFVAGSENAVVGNLPNAVISMYAPDMSPLAVQTTSPTPASNVTSVWRDIKIDSNGRVVAAGHANDPGNSDLNDVIIHRYIPANGPASLTADSAFATGTPTHRYDFNQANGERGIALDVSPSNTIAVAAASTNVDFEGIVHLSASGGTVAGWNSGNSMKVARTVARPSGIAFDPTNGSRIITAGMDQPVSTWSYVSRFAANGAADQTFGSFQGTTNSQFAGTPVTVSPLLAVDPHGRSYTALSDENTQLKLRRFTGDRPPVEAPTKILFDDYGGHATSRSMMGMSPSGNDVAGFGNINPGFDSAVQPAADQGGVLYYAYRNNGVNGSQSYLAAAGADSGQPFGTPAPSTTTKMFRPTVSNVSADVAYLSQPNGTGSICLKMTAYEAGFQVPADPPGGPLCDITDAAINSDVGIGSIAYVKDGDVWLRYGAAADVKLVDDGNASRVTWGFGGSALLYNAGPSVLRLVTFSGQSVTDPNWTPDSQPTNSGLGIMPLGTTLTGFALDPDGGDVEPITYSSGDTIYTWTGSSGSPTPRFVGVSPVVSQWQRNLSVYSPNGDTYRLSRPSVKAEDVPLQSKAPANPGGIETAGLLNLNLLRSPLFNLNLLRSPLLNLNLLRSPLLNLNLLRSPLLNLNLLRSPLVNDGLKRTSLSSLPIREEALATGGGWIDRIKAMNTPAALDLAKLPLVQITLADVAALGDTFNMPGLGDVDMSHALYGSVSVMPFMLGNTPVANIQGIQWCPVFEARGYANCGRALGAVNATTGAPLPGDGLTASLLSLQIAGFNLDGLPTTNGHVNDLRGVHWEDVTFDSEAIITKFVTYSTDPPGGVQTEKTSLGSALVRKITPTPGAVVWCTNAADLANKPAETIPVDCGTASTDTLHKASLQQALRVNKEVGDLGQALNGISVNEIALGLWGEPGDDPYDQPPGALGLAASNNSKTFVTTFARTAMGPGQSVDPRFQIVLPAGIAYTPNTSRYINTNTSQSEINVGDPVIQGDPLNGGQTISYTLSGVSFQGNSGGFLQVLFDTTAVGPTNGQAVVNFGDGYSSQTVDSAAFFTTEEGETGNSAITAGQILPDTLYFGRLNNATDVDYFQIPTDLADPDGKPIEKGSTVTLYLSQLNYDADLVLYHPPTAGLADDPMRPPSNAPAITPSGDPAQKLSNSGEPLVIEGENDIPLIPDTPVAGISNFRGNKAERIEAVTWGQEGPYIVQVSGFKGAFGDSEYAVRYTVTPPPTAPTAAPRTGFANTPVGLPAALTAADHPETLILTNMGRVERLYPGQSAALQTKVNALKASYGNGAVVLPVDGILGDANANVYADWDANPHDPDLANKVVEAINSRVDNYLGAHRPEIKSIIIVGSDEVIPMGRVPDLTSTGNERTFAQHLRETAAGNNNNALLGAALAGRTMTDDPYGAFAPRQFGGTWLYVPDVALGRLVETPGQMGATIDEYLTPQDASTPAGLIRPTATLSAGYDFMRTLSRSVTEAFAAQLPGLGPNNVSMIDGWNDTDIVNAVVNGGNAPTLISLNAHYAPEALAPAVGKSNVTAAQLTTAADLRRRLLFTMGCHSAFNISNYLQTGGVLPDFPEAMAGEPVGAFVGNTGYGIGVNGLNAFSQRLFSDFAYRVGQTTLGGALTQAKQEYLANGISNAYDYKVVAQTVFFGIPTYQIVGATPVAPPPPAPNPGSNPGNGGLKTSSLTFSQPTSGPDNDWTLVDEPGLGSRWEIEGGGANVSALRPVQPTVHRDVTVPGETAGTAVITSIKIAGDTDEFNPQFATPVLDSSAAQPEAEFGDMVFPGNPLKLTSFTGPNGEPRQRVVATMAQFTSDGVNSAGDVVGIERRFSDISYEVVYRPAGATDDTSPIITLPQALQSGGTTAFRTTVTDPESDVTRVDVLYRTSGSNEFKLGSLALVSLDAATHSSVWEATFPITGEIDYVIQALNSQALGAFSSAKGHFYDEAPRPLNTNTVSVEYSRTPDSGNVFYTTTPTGAASPVTVKLIESPTGAVATYTDQVDGGAVGPVTNYPSTGIVLSSPGTHHISYTTNDATPITGSVDVVLAPRPAEVVSITYDRSPDNVANGIYKSSVVATVNTTDSQSVVGIKLDSEPSYTTRPGNQVTVSGEGTHQLRYSTSRGSTNAATPAIVRIDLNAPTVNFTSPSSDGQVFAQGQAVNAAYTCSDSFLIDTCVGTPANGAPLDTSSVTPNGVFREVTVTATDKAGRTTTAVRTYRVVSGPDVLTATIDGSAITGIYAVNKTVRISSSQGNPITATVDGVTVTPTNNGDGSVNVPVSGDGDHALTYTATSPSGTVTNGSATVRIDLINPTINAVTPPSGTPSYVINSSVQAVYSCSDTHIATCTGPAAPGANLDTSTLGLHEFRITATDAAGRSTSVDRPYKVIDQLTVSVDGTTTNGFYTAATTLHVRSLGGSAVFVTVNGVETGYPTGVADVAVTVEGIHNVTYRTDDPDGPSGMLKIKLDLTAPSINFTSPVSGVPSFVFGATAAQGAKAQYSCFDLVAGIASCVGSQANGSALNTASVTSAGQTRSVSVTATDNVGRTATDSRAYKVQYADGTPCEGSLSHRLNGMSNPQVVPRSGTVVTLRFRICDANGVSVGPDRYKNTIGQPMNDNGNGVTAYCGPALGLLPVCLLPPLLSPRSTTFVYQSNHEWQFLQDTTGMPVGDHTFHINLNDGTRITYVLRVQ